MSRRSLLGFDQLPEHPSGIDVAKDVAGVRGLAIRKIHLLGGWIFLDLFRAGDRTRQTIANWEAVFGHVDCLLQHLGKGHGAPAIEQYIPRIDNAGQRRGKQSVTVGNLAAVVLVVPIDRRQLWCGSLGIDRVHLFLACVVDQDDRVGTQTIGLGIDQRSTACPATMASNALPPDSRIRAAALVASCFIDETAYCVPRTTGRNVRLDVVEPSDFS